MKYLQVEHEKHYLRWVLLILVVAFVCLLPSLAYGQIGSQPITPEVPRNPGHIGGDATSMFWVDVTQMLASLSKDIPILIRFVVAFSYTAGVCLVTMGIIKLKAFGHNTVMMSTQANAVVPMVYVMIGTMMIYFITVMNVGSSTLLGTRVAPLMGYSIYNEASPFSSVISVVVKIVQLVGYIAFLRGWFILMKLGSNNSPGTMGKGLVHLLGGVLAANIMTTWAVLTQTLGFMTTRG
jgi:intracellular multiplication protein IcmC